ncbi:MAG: hypothetical protein S4CHLAM81_01440 [Chlamydiales bacterium]|nr:hypothetical protein [Chlamydiales bacterium]MCH9634940.1 hypothetical protein [Chlamydiales bacterium]
MTIINPDQPRVGGSSPIVPSTEGGKDQHKPCLIALCAVLLQETADARTKSTAQDEKELASQGARMQNLNARERAMQNFNLVFETDYTTVQKITHNTPSLIHKYDYTSYIHHAHKRHQLTGAECAQELKRRGAQKEQIANSFGELQNAAQAPETRLNVDVNAVEQAEEQGINLLIKLQQLTVNALMTRS